MATVLAVEIPLPLTAGAAKIASLTKDSWRKKQKQTNKMKKTKQKNIEEPLRKTSPVTNRNKNQPTKKHPPAEWLNQTSFGCYAI